MHNNNKKKKNGKSELMSFSANQVNRHRFEKREIFTRKFNFSTISSNFILLYHYHFIIYRLISLLLSNLSNVYVGKINNL